MKICRVCNTEYEFFGQRASICRPCKRVYDREFHAKRTPKAKERKLELQTLRLKSNKEKVWNFLLKHPCEHCGEADPVVLEFDHIDRTTKIKAVSEMMTLKWDKIEAEINKCRVLCANCHRRHTAVQLGWLTF